MELNEFINLAKNMVIEYFNHYTNDSDKVVMFDDLAFTEIVDDGNIFMVRIIIGNDISTEYVVAYEIKNQRIRAFLYKELKKLHKKRKKTYKEEIYA